jgi:hypothetical protein
MKFNKSLMTGLIGLALMAAPITAAAQDQQNRGKSDSHQAQAQSHASAPRSDRAQARSNESERRSAPEAANRNAGRDERSARTETRRAEPEAANRNAARDERSARTETRRTEPEAANRAENEKRGERTAAVENRKGATTATRDYTERNDRNVRAGAAVTANGENRGDRNYSGDRNSNGSYSYNGSNDHGTRDYRNYGGHEYDHDREYAADGWVMPYGYTGGACAWARHLRNVYREDEYTGHPAAASDLLWQLRRAERNCGGVPYGYNSYPYPY